MFPLSTIGTTRSAREHVLKSNYVLIDVLFVVFLLDDTPPEAEALGAQEGAGPGPATSHRVDPVTRLNGDRGTAAQSYPTGCEP